MTISSQQFAIAMAVGLFLCSVSQAERCEFPTTPEEVDWTEFFGIWYISLYSGGSLIARKDFCHAFDIKQTNKDVSYTGMLEFRNGTAARVGKVRTLEQQLRFYLDGLPQNDDFDNEAAELLVTPRYHIVDPAFYSIVASCMPSGQWIVWIATKLPTPTAEELDMINQSLNAVRINVTLALTGCEYMDSWL